VCCNPEKPHCVIPAALFFPFPPLARKMLTQPVFAFSPSHCVAALATPHVIASEAKQSKSCNDWVRFFLFYLLYAKQFSGKVS
jgi:hypothetical protein